MAESHLGGEASAVAQRSIDVLIVDDDRVFLASIEDLVRKHGFVVRGVVSAEDAVVALRQGDRPKLILLDLVLPGMSARNFLTALKLEPAWALIPVVLVTAVTSSEVPRDLPVDSVLLKPIDSGELLSLVRQPCPRNA